MTTKDYQQAQRTLKRLTNDIQFLRLGWSMYEASIGRYEVSVQINISSRLSIISNSSLYLKDK